MKVVIEDGSEGVLTGVGGRLGDFGSEGREFARGFADGYGHVTWADLDKLKEAIKIAEDRWRHGN